VEEETEEDAVEVGEAVGEGVGLEEADEVGVAEEVAVPVGCEGRGGRERLGFALRETLGLAVEEGVGLGEKGGAEREATEGEEEGLWEELCDFAEEGEMEGEGLVVRVERGERDSRADRVTVAKMALLEGVEVRESAEEEEEVGVLAKIKPKDPPKTPEVGDTNGEMERLGEGESDICASRVKDGVDELKRD